MKIKVRRKVGEISLKATELFLPVFEVVVNAIHAIHEKISEHCLIYFITETMPRVLISDEQDDKTIDLAIFTKTI